MYLFVTRLLPVRARVETPPLRVTSISGLCRVLVCVLYPLGIILPDTRFNSLSVPVNILFLYKPGECKMPGKVEHAFNPIT